MSRRRYLRLRRTVRACTATSFAAALLFLTSVDPAPYIR